MPAGEFAKLPEVRPEQAPQLAHLRRPVLGSQRHRPPFLERAQAIEQRLQPFGAALHGQLFQRSQAARRQLFPHREIESIHGVGMGKARRQAQNFQRGGVLPSAQHGIHRARQESRHRVLFERLVEIEPRRDAETLERGAQQREHRFPPRAPRSPISRKGRPAAACSRMRRAISSVSRSMPGVFTSARAGAGRARATRSSANPMAARRARIGFAQVGFGGRERDLAVPAERRDHSQLRIGQGVETIQPNGADSARALRRDAFRRALQPPAAQRQPAPLQLPLHFLVDRQKRRGQRRIGQRAL